MKYIRVYNSGAPIALAGVNKQEYLVPRGTPQEPAVEDIPEDDVYYIAGKTSVFKTGRLYFADDQVEAIMEYLRIPNWHDSVITDADIEDALFHPTYDKMVKILTLADADTVERYRSMLVGIENQGDVGVSEKVARVIKERSRELANGNKETRIKITRDSFPAMQRPVVDEEKEMLKKQLAEMQAKLDALTAAKQETPAEAPVKKTTAKKATTK